MPRSRILTTSITAAAAVIVAGAGAVPSALGQSAQIPAPPQTRPIVIENATVHTISGETYAENGYVVFDDGVITDVGQGEAPSIPGAERMDARGLHVYPGLVASNTSIGLIETGAVDVTHDMRELGDFTPEVRAAVAINPDSDLIPVTRANGILVGLTFPQGGIISGRCAVIRLDGWTWEAMAIDDEAGIAINWPRTEPIRAPWMRTSEADQLRRIRESLDRIDQFFDEVDDYLRAKEADPTHRTDLRYEAMRAVVAGEKPCFVRADSAGQIESAVAWSVKRGVRIVIVGGGEADEAAPILRKHDVPVIINGVHNLPDNRHDAYDSPFTLPAKLHQAGVRFAIASGQQPAHERNLNHNAATAAAYGLPPEEAIKAVTLSAAQIIGVGDMFGSLDVGKSATIILTTGDPLEITSDTLVAFVDGRSLDLGSRHKRLYAKYREKYRQLGLIEQSTDPSVTRDTGSSPE